MHGNTKSRSTRFSWAVVAALALSLAALAAVGVAKDRNKDGLPDRWEKRHHLSLKVDQARRDQDSDALRNRGEFEAGMDPQDADTDGDGIADGDEGAGTITAWDPDTGELTINMFGGDSVTGTVTDDTQIECRNDDGAEPDDEGVEETLRPQGPPPAEPGDEPAGAEDESDETAPPTGGGGPHHGPDQAGEHDCDGSNCSVDDLAVDGVVSEASLRVTSDGLVYEEIELG
jgi:hypothetical protein